jgi:hypothetical protein
MFHVYFASRETRIADLLGHYPKLKLSWNAKLMKLLIFAQNGNCFKKKLISRVSRFFIHF